jgi:hypothetical protein
MRVRRMRIRFEDPHVAPDQAQSIARRVSELVTGEQAADQIEPTDRFDAADELARHVAGRVSDALHAAGERA